MEKEMKEFIAYSKKLLRVLRKIRELLYAPCEEDIETVKELLDELIEDTESDIQA